MSIALYVADSADRAVEQLLVDSGMRVGRISGDDLAALAHPTAAQPEALVLDLRRDRRIPAPVAVLRGHHPLTPVLVVASSLDPALMLEAMRAGVNECVAEPINPTEFVETLRRVTARGAGNEAGTVYAFIGAKGGVGTTTLAVNVAAATSQVVDSIRKVAQPHSSALLIDLHLMYGDCALFMGNDPRFSVVDALENSHRFDQAFLRGVVARHPGGPDLLGSSNRLMAAPSDRRRIEMLLELARQQYSHTFLDLPRSDGAALDALAPVATIVMVVSQDVATLRSARGIASVLRQRYGNQKVQFVLNRHDPQAEITKEDVDEALGEQVAFVIPSEYRTAVQAVNSGIPVVLGWPGKLAQSLKGLAGQLTGVTGPEAAPVEERPRGFLARFALARS